MSFVVHTYDITANHTTATVTFGSSINVKNMGPDRIWVSPYSGSGGDGSLSSPDLADGWPLDLGESQVFNATTAFLNVTAATGIAHVIVLEA